MHPDCRTIVRVLLAAWSCVVAADADAQENPGGPLSPDVALGEAIFLHNWARPDSWTRPEVLGDGGDGLGPAFNDVSCVACHAVGGIGGAGGRESNIDLLSIEFPPQATDARRVGLVKRAKQVHGALTPSMTSVMLHRFAFGTDDDLAAYDVWRAELVSADGTEDGRLSIVHPTQKIGGVPFRLSQRSPPPLWGVGEIERLRVSVGDGPRQSLILDQNGRANGVSGRIPRAEDGRVGWYGWRGEVQTLRDFVLSACANELGLHVEGHPQSENPLTRRSAKTRDPRAIESWDLTDPQTRALTAFVMSLPRPAQVFPNDPTELSDVYEGERVFDEAGCAQCHVPQFGSIAGVYSDFLLHDMGYALLDPAEAYPEPPSQQRRMSDACLTFKSQVLRRTRTNAPIAVGDLPRFVIPEPKERPRLTHEWRTPPLWGVADTAPYLHDGRAETLDEAIRLHDGEARVSAEAYRYLSEADRGKILTFLGTLRAPQSAIVTASGNP